jgi:hypothetical protein
MGTLNTGLGYSLLLGQTSAPTLGTFPLSFSTANYSVSLPNTTPASQGSLATSTSAIVINPPTLNVNGISGLVKQGSGSLAVSTAGIQNLVLGGTFNTINTINTINTTATQISTQATPVTISSGTLALQGVTTINSSLTLQNSALLRVRINSTNPGDGYDQLNVSGDVALQGDLAITAAPSLPAGASFTILNKTSAGPISGTFAGRPQGSVVIVNNNAGNGETGLAALLKAGRVRKVICSFPRQVDSHVFDGLYRSGQVELELAPQGNLAERIRAAGAGIGAENRVSNTVLVDCDPDDHTGHARMPSPTSARDECDDTTQDNCRRRRRR